ncbi:aldose epimerase family protein [Pseudalkalibacillus sp. JSM 102089]|uniref:aldose epimerase family protein n=1 Tax=Pseudalkalibacillus sp. JSM 102089 TaxID=3229856 RepID=UPI00352396D5
MNISQENFGTLNGQDVTLFKLQTKSGFEISCIDYGCIITRILSPNKNGQLENIVLGYDTLEEYLTCSNYFGAVIGRVAGRIDGGSFELGGKEFHLHKNDANNHIHGGSRGFNSVIWDAKVIQNHQDEGTIEFKYHSADGEEGYPGNVEVVVRYTLNNQDELTIHYSATSDKDTIMNLTNHTYFNLSGDLKEDVLSHSLKLKSNYYLELNRDMIPTGKLLNVQGTSFDFRDGNKLSEGVNHPHEQNLLVGEGYDHPFILEDHQEIVLSSSGRKLTVATSEPCVVLYTGNSICEGFKIREVPSKKYLGVCLETQKHPNAINQPEFPSVVLSENTPYESKTRYKFQTR